MGGVLVDCRGFKNCHAMEGSVMSDDHGNGGGVEVCFF